jgi:glucose/arabinose dehydrogenase
VTSRLLLVALFILATPQSGASAEIALAPLVDGFDRPVQIVSAHDGTHDLYIAQQDGRIFRFNGVTTTLFADLRDVVECCPNGGLLSLVFHPHYATNRQFFVQYVNRNSDTTIARYTGTTAEVLIVAPQPKEDVPNHHGGTLQFGPDGMLYVSIGDGGAYVRVTNRAQELDHLLGKLLRIDVDHGTPYAIPADNPFATSPGIRPEIWSYGLRNPWRFSFDRATGELLMGDVGQDSFEELDITTIAAARGANFGWPMTEGLHCYLPAVCRTDGLTLPRLEYPRAEGCSVTGGYRYRGTRWRNFRDVYFYGDWCTGRIWAATQNASGEWTSRVVLQSNAAVVSFGEDDDGELYVVDYNGRIFRIVDAPAPRVRVSRPL